MPNRKNKKGNRVEKLAVVVTAGKTQNKKKPRRTRPKLVRAQTRNPYLVAMTHPFSLAAEGARVPDGCSLPTVPFTVTKKVNLTSDASGEWDFLAFPSLATCMISPRASLVSGKTILCGSPTSLTPLAVGSAEDFDVVGLSNQYQHYRIVGWGLRLRTQAGITTNGEITGAVLPLKGMLPFTSSLQPFVTDASGTARGIPSYSNLGGPIDTLAQYLGSMGAPVAGGGNAAKVDIPKLVSCPVHGTASHGQLAARGLHFRSKPFEPGAAEFRRITYSTTGTDSADIASFASGGGVQQWGVDLSGWKLGGFESMVIGGSGYPASSNIGSVEVIYHIEATLNPNISTLHRPACGASPVDPRLHAHAHASLTRTPHISFSDVVQQGEDYVLGQVEGAAGALAQRGLNSLGGMLSRMLTV